MLIIDLNQVMIANITEQLGNYTNTHIEEDTFRLMVLNTLRSVRQQFQEYGEMVIACDDKRYWRKREFPHYKANRRKARESSDLDWNQIFGCLNMLKAELREYSPYKVLQVDGAEADDIIAALCIEYGSISDDSEKIMILSGDKDFGQLQVYKNVEQYDPILKKSIKRTNPHKYLREHILNGDRGDGIPNIMSSDTCFVNNEKHVKITAKRLEYFVNIPDLEAVLPKDQYANFKRNEKLIDLHMIPDDLRQSILEHYRTEQPNPKTKLNEYFITFNLKSLTTKIDEF